LVEPQEPLVDVVVAHLPDLQHLLHQRARLERYSVFICCKAREVSRDEITALQPVIPLYFDMTGVVIILVGLELKLARHTEEHHCKQYVIYPTIKMCSKMVNNSLCFLEYAL
jgi:hypothetical protein